MRVNRLINALGTIFIVSVPFGANLYWQWRRPDFVTISDRLEGMDAPMDVSDEPPMDASYGP